MDEDAIIDKLIERRRMGASVQTVVEEDPSLEGMDEVDLLALLNRAVTRLARSGW